MVKKTLNQQQTVNSRSRITRQQTQIIANSDEVSRYLEKKISTQIYLEDNEDFINSAPSDLSFDNFDESSLQASNGAQSEHDDYLFSDNESTASFRYSTKQISKSSKSLKYAKNGKPRSSRQIKISNSFEEDTLESSSNTTYDYNIMRFQNLKRKKTFRIYCFNELDLNIPQKFQESIVQNESDDDKESDHEQVENAIHHVHKSLLEAIQEEKSN